MKLFTSPLSALLLLATLAGQRVAHALTIDSTSVNSVNTNDSHQTLEKTWTVTSSDQLRALAVAVPARVFVDYDASLQSSGNVVAKVVVSGDSQDLIDLFEVVEGHQANELKIQLKNQHPNRVNGYVLTQVHVRDKSVLSDFTSVASADTIISDNVLVGNNQDASLSLTTTGSGDIYIPSKQKYDLKALKVQVSGSGDVQFHSPSIAASKGISLSITGSGNIALLADTVTATDLSTATDGSGGTFVQTNTLTAMTLSASIQGSGDVSFYTSGTCENEQIDVEGSGTVYAGSIVCKNTDVTIIGSGDVLVHTVNDLKAAVFASGEVSYVGAPPNQVKLDSFGFKHHKVQAAKSNKFHTYHNRAIPARDAVHVIIIRTNFRGAVDFNAINMSSAGSVPYGGVKDLGMSAFVIAAVVAVGVAVTKYKAICDRLQYEPLV